MKAPPCAFNEIVGKIQVLTLEVRTVLPAEELGTRLRACFGAGGLGLDLREEPPGSLLFEGGGGSVTATLHPDGSRTHLRIVTSGWAVPVKRFVTGLP
jgi:hypothetical protein